MENKRKPKGYWKSIENCKIEALKYNCKKDYNKYSCGSYISAQRNGWLDEICSHMNTYGNVLKRCIYAYEFSDNHVYIGLTYNLKNRNNDHISGIFRSSVFDYIKKTSLIPELKQLTDYINVEDAKIKEGEFVKKYKNDGWNILNKSKTGGLGGNTSKWTYDKCKEEISKYEKFSELMNNNRSVYNSIKKNGWFDLFEKLEKRNPDGYWTFEKCKEEALKYNNRKDFMVNSSSAYVESLKNKWSDTICTHMIRLRVTNSFWTKAECINVSKKCSSKIIFKKQYSYVYKMCIKNNWLDDISKINNWKSNKKRV